MARTPRGESPFRLFDLKFPAGGLERRAAFQDTPPYSTPYCFNVRPFDIVNLAAAQMHGGRQRGGARPGLVKLYVSGSQPQAGNPIQMLVAASRRDSGGVASNLLLAVANGVLYENSTGAMAAVSGTLNSSAKQLRATQVGDKVYIADFRPVKVTGTDGTIANGNRLSDPTVTDWTTLAIDTDLDVLFVFGSVATEANIFPITSVTAGYVQFDTTVTGSMTNQTGEVIWELGRICKVFDPSTAAVAKLYLTTNSPGYTPATIRGAWDDTAGAVTKMLDTSKDSGGELTTVARAETNTSNEYDVLLYRGVSGALATQTINCNLNVMLGIRESAAAANFHWHVHVYVTQGDSDTPRGTLLTDYTEALGVNEFGTAAATNGKALNAAQAVNLAIQTGDRIVVEIGYRARNSVATSYTGTLNYGTLKSGAIAGDLSTGAAGANLAGYISFSSPIVASDALVPLMDSLPIPLTNYDEGIVSITNGAATFSLVDLSDVPQASDENMMSIEIPDGEGGTLTFIVAAGSIVKTGGVWHLTLDNTTSDADCTWESFTLSWTGDYYGLPPLNAQLCCMYWGRLVLAAGPFYYISRVLDVNDWDYGYDPNDVARPLANTAPVVDTSTGAGAIDSDIVALMTHAKDYLVMGCERSLWIMHGDPAFGGTVQALSREIGVAGPDAWCNLPDGRMMFLSRDGVYQIGPGGAGGVQPLSRELLPAELRDIDWRSNTVAMGYDLRERGIHLDITPHDGTAGTHFFIDAVLGRFWPAVFGNNSHQPVAVRQYAANAADSSKLIVAGYDGYLRYYDPTAVDDDGTALTTLVCYGPFQFGGPGMNGMIAQMQAELDANGQGATWGLFRGDSPQEAVQAVVTAGAASGGEQTGSWSAGLNLRDYIRFSGPALIIAIGGGYGWAMEGLKIQGGPFGPLR